MLLTTAADSEFLSSDCESKLGYVLTERYPDPDEVEVNNVSSCMVTIMSQSDSLCLSDFWNLETIGICDPIHIKDDDRALD